MDCSILSGHRKIRPFGLKGGEAGECGRNLIRRKDSRIEEQPGCTYTVIEADEAVTIITPTGGGYGIAATPQAEAE
jgi:5-oxoprolinase (ATP-hydrolysing)